MASQQPQFGARYPVPWQVTDRIEQRRAKRVIQESRRQSPLAELQETLRILRERVAILNNRRYRNGLHRANRSLARSETRRTASSLVLLGEFLGMRFSVGIEARLVTHRPCRSLSGSVDAPVGTATLQYGAHIQTELLDGGPAEEPVAAVDLEDEQTGLQHHGMGDHRIVIRVGIFTDVEILLHPPPRV